MSESISGKGDNDGDKLFMLIWGQPRTLQYDFPPTLFWAKSREDVVRELIRTKSHLVRVFPLQDWDDHPGVPSEFHCVNCFDDACPCANYFQCHKCEGSKTAIPEDETITIECDGKSQNLQGGGETCSCDKPDFTIDKAKICCSAVDTYEGSGYCCILLELCLETAMRCSQSEEHGSEDPKKAAKTTR